MSSGVYLSVSGIYAFLLEFCPYRRKKEYKQILKSF